MSEADIELVPDEKRLYGNNYQLRYEELKKKYRSVLAALNETIKECEEQDKIIVLMAEELSEKDENSLLGYFTNRSVGDIIEYFEKKARGD